MLQSIGIPRAYAPVYCGRDQLVGLTPILRYFGRLQDPLYGGDAFTSVQVRGEL